MMLKSNESIDDLQISGLKIIQNTKGFRFGTDAVILADFSKNIRSGETLDLCTGSGIIPLLLYAKTNTPHFCGIEIQEEIADMAKRSVEMNNLNDKIDICCGDLKNSISIYGKRRFDLITCNPPYMKAGSAILNETDAKIISRHEVKCTLKDIIKVSSSMLTLTGHLTMVHKPSRLCDIIYLMRSCGIEPKRLRFIHNHPWDAPMLVLIDGLYGGKSDVKILPPLILRNDDGSDTEEYEKIHFPNKNI